MYTVKIKTEYDTMDSFDTNISVSKESGDFIDDITINALLNIITNSFDYTGISALKINKITLTVNDPEILYSLDYNIKSYKNLKSENIHIVLKEN